MARSFTDFPQYHLRTNNPCRVSLTAMDQRREKRKPFTLHAIAKWPPAVAVHVMIEDISSGGAKLATASTAILPDNLSLEIASNVVRKCRVAWRSHVAVGVAFESRWAAARPVQEEVPHSSASGKPATELLEC